LKGQKKKIFPMHYAPGKKLFHIVVRLSDAPGSYSSILDLVSKRVNFVGTQTYSMGDGTAIFSGFSEAISPDETPKRLEELILHSRAAMEAEVFEGTEGLIVDAFHTGLTDGNDDYVMLRREGLVHMFDDIARFFGSGGDSLLYQEGRSVGIRNAELLTKLIGMERYRSRAGSLSRLLAALGWGVIGVTGKQPEEPLTIVVEDCFECSQGRGIRRGCNFLRGYIAGAAGVGYEGNATAEELKCRLRGARLCEFRVAPSR
jgi:predicted hydrocarbon binding protein